MKRIFAILALAIPFAAGADHLDVIETKLSEGCSFNTQLQIMRDFNSQWGSKNGYKAELLMPLQSQNLVSIYWIGRSKNAAAFGKAWDTWRDELANPDSVASKLWVRFEKCGTNIARRGYDVYQ